MSYTTWETTGYGFITDKIEEVSLQRFLNLFDKFEAPKTFKKLKKFLGDDFEECKKSDDLFHELMAEYESDNCLMGVSSLLADIMQETAKIYVSIVDDFDGNTYIIYECGMPWQFSEAEKNLTTADVDVIYDSYLSVLTDDYKSIKYEMQFVKNGG